MGKTIFYKTGKKRLPGKEKIKRSRGEKILYSIVFVILCLHILTFLFAFGLTFLNTFKGKYEYLYGNTYGWPEAWVWTNYESVFEVLVVNNTGYIGMFFNSIWETVGAVLLTTLSTTMASYAYARYAFPMRKGVYWIAIVLLTISLPGSLPATYKLYSDLNLRNSPLFLIGATGGLGTYFIVLTGFWRSVSWEYAEAAFVDGAGDMTVFWRIMVPQAFPIMGTMFLLGFIAGWTDANTSMLYLPEYPSMAFGLYEYENITSASIDYPVYFAGLILAAVPSILLYGLFQDRIMTAMNIGGLKG